MTHLPQDTMRLHQDEIRALLDPFPEGVRKMLYAIIDRPDLPLRMVRMANDLRWHARVRDLKWEELALLGRRLAPGDPEVLAHSDWALRKKVPNWHFPLVHDELRNRAYQDALERCVTPSSVVFEIGTGTGILAMMAARAGARHVYTCEMEGVIADAARENIRRNGFEERITVIGKKSTDVELGSDIPERADLLVAEIVDNRLLGEKVLALTEDAKRRLLKPGAQLLPSRIASIGAVVPVGPWTRTCRVGTISGFDLSALNSLASSEVSVPADPGLDQALSDPFELFAFDLAGCQDFPAQSRNVSVKITRAGRAAGVVRWLRLEFGEGLGYENRPPQHSAWSPLLHLFPHETDVRTRDLLPLLLTHNRENIFVSLAGKFTPTN